MWPKSEQIKNLRHGHRRAWDKITGFEPGLDVYGATSETVGTNRVEQIFWQMGKCYRQSDRNKERLSEKQGRGEFAPASFPHARASDRPLQQHRNRSLEIFCCVCAMDRKAAGKVRGPISSSMQMGPGVGSVVVLSVYVLTLPNDLAGMGHLRPIGKIAEDLSRHLQ